jgi:hypothetical protein
VIGVTLALVPRTSSEQEETRRRPPFGLYDSFLEAERDDVYEHLSIRLKWFGEDCLRASERILAEPRYGLELIEHLSTTVQQLDKIAGNAQAKEEMMWQAMSWRVAAEDLLPNHELRDDPHRNQARLQPDDRPAGRRRLEEEQARDDPLR